MKRAESAPTRPPIRLRGALRQAYVARTLKLVSDRRINRAFVPTTEVARLFLALLPEREGSLDDSGVLELDARSGMPTLPELLSAMARLKGSDEGPGLSRFRVEARVRRAVGQRADLKVVVDRFDPTSNTFRRVTLELSSDGCADVRIHGDRAILSGALETTLFRFCTAAPALLLARMGEVCGVTPSHLQVGITGPLAFAQSQAPDELAGVFEQRPDAVVLVCSLASLRPAEATRHQRFYLCASPHFGAVRAALPGRIVWRVR